MKKFIIIALLLSLCNCSNDNYKSDEDDTPEATILGRWILQGFEDNIRMDFTESKRFDIYGTDGVFPTLEEFILQNPQLTGLDWFYEGETIVVDLNFGNTFKFRPNFVCNNYVVELLDENEESLGYYYRENFDISTCDAVE